MATFAGLVDPRRVGQYNYPLQEMLRVALCGVIHPKCTYRQDNPPRTAQPK
jgi:hypothetical protein